MSDVASRIPYLQRRVEELGLEDEVKQRPREQESDKQATGTGSSTSSDKEPALVDDGVSPMELQENEDEGSSAEEYSDGEEYEAPEEIDRDAIIQKLLWGYTNDLPGKRSFGYCTACVDNEVCKICGHKNGRPPDYNPVNCIACGTNEHRNGYCVTQYIDYTRLGCGSDASKK